jgi:hypothetical protein
MRLNTPAVAVAFAILWGACVFIVGVANMIWPGYGRDFLQLTASIYPGYHPGNGVGSVIVGTLYALVDGCIGGAVFGWLYNLIAGE